MIEDQLLARFQAALLRLLDQGFPPEQIIADLQADAELSEFAPYVATFDSRMVEVAVELLAKWGEQTGSGKIR